MDLLGKAKESARAAAKAAPDMVNEQVSPGMVLNAHATMGDAASGVDSVSREDLISLCKKLRKRCAFVEANRKALGVRYASERLVLVTLLCDMFGDQPASVSYTHLTLPTKA